MEFKLFKVSGYEEAILSLRMSKGKFYSWEKAQEIQDLVYVCTDKNGFLADEFEYRRKLDALFSGQPPGYIADHKITEDYEKDVQEFKRLLQLTFDNAMASQKHHTLMKYLDVSFISEGLHRGAQDDLDAHAIAFNNRITRFSTRLAEISDVQLSEWYYDKVIPFHEVHKRLREEFDLYAGDPALAEMAEHIQENSAPGTNMPNEIYVGDHVFLYTPFGYVLDKYAQVPAKNGLAKDVQRGLMPLGLESNALWKSDFFNLRYVYSMRSKLTKANPELKAGMEQLADQIEAHIPVFGPYFRKVFTDSKQWEHVNKVKTITSDEYQELQQLRRTFAAQREATKL